MKGRMPKLVVTQFAGCAPVVKAFDEGKAHVEPWGELDVPPGGLKSPNPPAGAAVLAILKKHGGAAIAVTTDEALREVDAIAGQEGLFACPESATTIAGLRKALARGVLAPTDCVVAVCTGSGLKSIPTLPVGAERRIEIQNGWRHRQRRLRHAFCDAIPGRSSPLTSASSFSTPICCSSAAPTTFLYKDRSPSPTTRSLRRAKRGRETNAPCGPFPAATPKSRTTAFSH